MGEEQGRHWTECNDVDASFQHGRNFKIGRYCCIEADVVVGDDVELGYYVLLERGTRIGSGTFVDSYVRSAGDNRVGDRVTLRFGSTVARKVHIDDDAFISPNVMTIYSRHTGETTVGALTATRVRGVHAPRSSGSPIERVAGSTSAERIVAPRRRKALAVDGNVKVGITISSPGPRSRRRAASSSALVQDGVSSTGAPPRSPDSRVAARRVNGQSPAAWSERRASAAYSAARGACPARENGIIARTGRGPPDAFSPRRRWH